MSKKIVLLFSLLVLISPPLYGQESVNVSADCGRLIVADSRNDTESGGGSGKAPAWLKRSGSSWQQPGPAPDEAGDQTKQEDAAPSPETRPEWLKRSGSSWQQTKVPSEDDGKSKQDAAGRNDDTQSGIASRNQPKFLIFRPLNPLTPPAGMSNEKFRKERETQWEQALGGRSTDKHGDLVKDLVDYEINPNIVTALGALEHFNTLSHDDSLRGKAHEFNLSLFLTLDALKFELPLQAVIRENNRRRQAGEKLIEFSYRVGSSGKRFRQWVQWAATGKDLSNMPIDDLYKLKKLSKSDDDNTNQVADEALRVNPLLNEQVNGKRMEDVVARITGEWTGGKMVVKASEDLQMEFLSPTKAYPIIYVKRHRISISEVVDGNWDPAWNEKWPNFLAADIAGNKEKYRGAFAEEQLHAWGLLAGYVVDLRNIGADPTIAQVAAATTDYAESGIAKIKGTTPFPEGIGDPFGWMANQYREAFLVHKGSVQDVAKYTQRMTAWWDTFNIKTAQDLRSLGIDIGDTDFNLLEDLARKIRSPKNEAELVSAIGTSELQGEALKKLKDFNKMLLRAGHRRHVADLTHNLITVLRGYGDPGKGPTKEGRAPPTIDALMAVNNGDNPFYKTMETLATAYSNLPGELIDELNQDHARQIKEKEKSNTPDAIYEVEVHKVLLAAMARAQKAGARLSEHGQAFTEIHGLVDELRDDINEHLKQIADGADLDGYIDQVIAGKMKRKRVRVIWQGEGALPKVTWATEQWDPADVRDDLKVLHNMADLCGWSSKTYAQRLYEYFEGPGDEIRKKNILTQMRHKSWAGLALEGLRSLRDLYDPKHMKERFVELNTSEGKPVRLQLSPTGGRLEAGLNLGVTSFKLTIKGAQGVASLWKVSGDVTDFKELGLNIYKTVVPEGAETMETRAQRYATILSKTISLFEYAENVAAWAKNPFLVDKLGASLATAAELSADPYNDEAVQKLASAMLKDIALWVQPELVVAFASYEIYQYGSATLSLQYAKENFVNLLVENGDWEWKDEKGNDLPRPRLKGVYITKGSSPLLIDEKARKEGCVSRAASVDATGRFRDGATCNDGLTRLTKLPEPAWKNGIKLFKSGGTVHPRQDLLTIFYKDGYETKDEILKHIKKSVSKIPQGGVWTSSKDWTKKWLEQEANVYVETPEDATAIVKAKIRVEMKKVTYTDISQGDPMTLSGVETRTVDAHLLADVQEGVRKNFGFLVSEYWTRRQNIMECAMLDPLVEMATRRKEEERIGKIDFDKFLTEMRRLDKRMQELDRKVWAEIARSADPFEGPDYQPDDKKERYIPITKDYRKRTAPLRTFLEKSKEAVDDINKRNTGGALDSYEVGDEISDLYDRLPSGMKDPEMFGASKLSIMATARRALDKMCKVVEAYEDTYNGVLTLLAKREKWVGENSGMLEDSAGVAAPGLALKPFHLRLRPGRTYFQRMLDDLGQGSMGDVSYLSPKPGLESELVAMKWDEAYRKEYDTVRDDLGAIIKKMQERLRPLVDAGDLLPILGRTIWLWWVEFMHAEHQELATYHPYWTRMLRLRFQIRKIDNMLPGADEATKEEVESAFEPMVLEKKRGTEILEGWDGTKTASHLRKARAQMMIRYEQLKKLAERMFDIELKIKPEDDLKVTDKMIVTLETRPRKDLNGPDEKEIQQLVRRYLFELAPQDPSAFPSDPACLSRNDGRFWPADFVATPKPLTAKQSASNQDDRVTQDKQNPPGDQVKAAGTDAAPSVIKEVEWKKRLRKSGKYQLRVIALSHHDVPLAASEPVEVEIKPARMLGKLEIIGEWDTKADPVAVFMGLTAVDEEEPRFRLTQAGDFDMPLCSFSEEEIPSDAVEPDGQKAEPAKFPPKRFEAYAGVENLEKLTPDEAGIKEPAMTLEPKSKIMAVRFEERAKFKVEKPLQLEFSQGVTITVKVFDAGGRHTINNAAVTIHGGGASQSGDTARMMLKPKDVVYATVGYSGEGFRLTRESKQVIYDPEVHAKGITIRVNMPFFPKGALTIQGRFVPEGGITDKTIIGGGDVWSNIADKQTVNKGGEFEFKNDRPILVKDGLELNALVFRAEDKRLMAPVDGKMIKKKIVPKAVNDLGDIGVKPYDVEVDGIRVAIRDWTGRPMPDKGTSVKVGDQKANRVGEQYECRIVFKFRGNMDIEAGFDMPTGDPVTGTVSISLDQFGDPFKPKPPEDPFEIDLGVYLPGSLKIKGRTEVEVLKGMMPPEKVDLWMALGHPDLFEEWSETVGTEFLDELTDPVRRDAALNLEATAASEDAIFSAKVSKQTPKAHSQETVAIVDFGTIRLKGRVKLVAVPNVIGKKLKEATALLTSHGFRVAPQDADPAPKRAKEQEVYQQAPVQKTTGPLKLARGAEIKLWAYGAVKEDPSKPYRPKAYIESVRVDKPVAWRGDTVRIIARIFVEDMKKGNPIKVAFSILSEPDETYLDKDPYAFHTYLPSKSFEGDYVNQTVEVSQVWPIETTMLESGDFYPYVELMIPFTEEQRRRRDVIGEGRMSYEEQKKIETENYMEAKTGKMTVKGKTNRLFECDIHGPMFFNGGSADYPFTVRVQYFAFGLREYEPKGQLRFVVKGIYSGGKEKVLKVSTNAGTLETTLSGGNGNGSQSARSPLEGVLNFKDLKLSVITLKSKLNGADAYVGDAVMTVSGHLDPGGPLVGNKPAEASGTFRVDAKYKMSDWSYQQMQNPKPIWFSGTWWAGRGAAASKGRKDDPKYEIWPGERHYMITGEEFEERAAKGKSNNGLVGSGGSRRFD